MVWAELQRQLDAMGLQVSLTSVSESLDVIKTSSVERFRMIHSSKQIRGASEKKKPCGVDAKTRRSKDGTWTKKGKESYFATSFTRKLTSITD